MGALHDGHGSLIRAAAARDDIVAVSVFVNPLQFGDPSDLERYPRSLQADVALAKAAGATVVIAPEVAELYPTWPAPPATTVTTGPLGTVFEGAARPGHFDGVATVVTKLLSALRPTRAYFGEKDFQQLAVIRQFVADLWLGVEIVGCETSREPDGLARSSRNVRLSAAARAQATCLSQALRAASDAFAADPTLTGTALEEAMAAVIAAGGCEVVPEYAVVVNASTLERTPGAVDPTNTRCIVTTIVGGVRLLDNAALLHPPAR
jgi:pantoate--beta-alanine ligase